MDKQTLSNYGWIVIAVLVLAVMIALATPFGNYIENAVVSARDGLFDVNNKALQNVGVSADGIPADTDTMIYRLSSLDPDITYTNFTVTSSNRAKVGYTGAENENLVIPVAFKDGDKWYKVTSIGFGAFLVCTSLTSIDIPDSVTSIDGLAFYETSLTSVVIPDSVTSISYATFGGCTSLTTITFENPNGWWYADIADATSGTSIDVTDPATNAQNLSENYSIYSKYFKRS